MSPCVNHHLLQTSYSDALIYEYNNKSLKVGSILYSFDRTMVVGSFPGPRTYFATNPCPNSHSTYEFTVNLKMFLQFYKECYWNFDVDFDALWLLLVL